MAQQVKDPMLCLQWLGSLPRCRFDPWPWNFHMMDIAKKEKEKGFELHIAAL